MQQSHFLDAGCEAELYLSQDNTVLKIFYKKIPKIDIDFVYNKHLVLKSVASICRGLVQGSSREYLVFKHVQGQALSEIANCKSLSLLEAFRVVKKVTNIVVKMHEKGVVHGDIHGENVMINELEKVTLIDLYSKEKSPLEDIIDICKLFHEVKYNSEPLPQEMKDLFPKKRDAILRRYENIKALQDKIVKLTR